MPRVAKSAVKRQTLPTMDTEQINAIGALLEDLTDRTEQLRGYL